MSESQASSHPSKLVYIAAVVIVLVSNLFAGASTAAEGPYNSEAQGRCYDGASCYAQLELYITTVSYPGNVKDCENTNLLGPAQMYGQFWTIEPWIACTWISNGKRFGALAYFDAPFYDETSECYQVPGQPPVCPDAEGYAVEVPPQKPEDCEGNPCNVATGVKTQTEVDFASPVAGGLRFVRYYSSQGAFRTGDGMGIGWRHTYSRAMGERPNKKGRLSFVVPSSRSETYGTAADACTNGWNDIKVSAFGGDLSGATATFVGGNTCEISSGGVTKAYLDVSSNLGWLNYTPPADPKYVTRPNGTKAVFEQQGASWVNALDPSVKLEQTGTDWIFTDANGNRETYDASGRLVSIASLNGRITTLEHDLTAAQSGDDNPETLDRVTGPFGHTISLTYDGNGDLASITTPDGVTQYSYNGDDHLTTVTRPDASTRQYHNEEILFGDYLTGITDENGDRYATWEYDIYGRAIRSEHAGGQEKVEFEYNADGSTTVTTAGGASRTYTFSTEQGRRRLASVTGDVCSDCPNGKVASKTYNSNGYVDEVTDKNGVVTQTIRNSRGLIETLIEAKGTTDQRTVTTTWHPTLPLPATITTAKNVTTYTYDPSGNPLTITRSAGALSRAWTFTYDAFGHVRTYDGPRTDVSDVTTFDYYDCSTGSQCGQLQKITNALGHETTFDTYDGAGRLTQMTDPNGLQTTFAYDNRGELTSITETPSVGPSRSTVMTYDNVGQLKTLTLPDGTVLTYTYDAAHYLKLVTDNLGNSIAYDYDAMGNLIDEDTKDPSLVLTRALEYTYDLNDRIDTVTDGGFTTDVTVDLVGNLVDTTDPNTNLTQHTYDALNRLDTTIDALTGVADYDFDVHDNLTQVVAANGATTSYSYDDLDNLLSETSPDRGLISYTHDDAGNVLIVTDARGIVSTRTYDALNRLTSITYPTTSENVTYTYDNASANGIGYVAMITDASGTTSFTYDEFGNVATDSRLISGVTYAVSYTYDPLDRVSSVTYPSGRVVDYVRDTIGQVSQVTSTMGATPKTIVSNATYEPFGPLSQITYGNGVSYDYGYRTDYRVEDIYSAGVVDKSYGYDPGGNIIDTSDGLDTSLNREYEYDALDRLTAEIDVGSGSYAGMVLADNPLGYWRLGEQVGPTAVDQTGNGYDGTYTGALSFGEPGLAVAIDTAVGVDTIGAGYVQGPTLTGTTLTAAEVWFETESLSSPYHMPFFSLYKYPSSYTRMLITHLPDGKIAVYRNRSSKEITSDSVISIGEPHHVAVWYESASNTTYMMIDGVVQQDTYTGNLLATPDPEVLIAAFRYYNTLYTRYIGVVDEVAIYDGTVNATMFANHSTGGHDGLQFAYDANGNRTSLDDGSTVTTYGYDVASNRLNAIAAASVQLDAAGNWTGDPGGVRTYEYSDANRLDAVKDNGITTATYAHNALGQRVNKTVGGTTTVYVYDVNGNLLAEHDGNGAHIRDYVWMNGAPIAQVDAGETFSYLHFDHLGTPRIATDDAQTVVWRWDSNAFGETAANDDPDGNGTPLTVNLRFPGQYYDVETGFHYNYYRTYDPSTGRYLESDPVGLFGGLNTYGYALQNPLSYTDPKGLWVPLAVGIGRAVYGGYRAYRAYRAAQAARTAAAVAARAAAAAAPLTIPGDTPGQAKPPLPFPIPGTEDLALPSSQLFEGVADGEGDYECFENCAAAYRVGMAACFQLYGNDVSSPGISPSDDRLAQCTWIVNETFKQCTDLCAQDCPE